LLPKENSFPLEEASLNLFKAKIDYKQINIEVALEGT
jgi:hypothetical protein